MILKIIFIIAFFSFPSMAGWLGFKGKCYDIFQSPPKYQFSYKTQWDSTYSQEIYFSVYKQLQDLEENGLLSKKELNYYIPAVEEIIKKLESPSLQVESRLKLLELHLFKAIQAFPEIVSFSNSKTAKEHESLDEKTVVKITLSTLSYHLKAYLSHHHPEKLDWPRINKILSAISEFKNKPNAFSLYKIQRSVREKYSINEYLKCL